MTAQKDNPPTSAQASSIQGASKDAAPAAAPTQLAGIVGQTLGLGSAAAAAVGQTFSDTFQKAPTQTSSAELQNFSPRQGYPKDSPVQDAATGGKAATLAPLAAAVASGTTQSEASQNLQVGQPRKEVLARCGSTGISFVGHSRCLSCYLHPSHAQDAAGASD